MSVYIPQLTHVENGLVDTVGEGESGANWESSIDIYTLSCVKQIASEGGSMAPP